MSATNETEREVEIFLLVPSQNSFTLYTNRRGFSSSDPISPPQCRNSSYVTRAPFPQSGTVRGSAPHNHVSKETVELHFRIIFIFPPRKSSTEDGFRSMRPPST